MARTYHAWRSPVGAQQAAPAYADVPGFCKSATTEEIAAQGYILTPGGYPGAEPSEDDGERFEEKMKRLATKLEEQFAESARLDAAIRQNLAALGYPVKREKVP